MSGSSGAQRRARRIARWIAPSVVAATIGCALAAVVDGVRYVDGAARIGIAAGFGFALGAPIALAVALTVRAAVAAWQPRALIGRLTDADGAAPRLAGWLVGGAIGLGLVGAVTNQAVLGLARFTAWKPRTIRVVLPVIEIVAVAAIAIVTVPIAVGCGRAFAALVERRRRRGAPVGLSPRRIFTTVALVIAIAVIALWWIAVRPLTRHLAIDGGEFVAVALAALIAIHVGWPRLPRRALAGAAAVIAALLLGAALWARLASPTTLLGLWGGDGFGGFAIDTLVDVRAVRAAIPPSTYRPVTRPGGQPRDVILLTIDTFRPDRLAAYGGTVPTPGLTQIARRGMVFDLALAPSNVTRRSLPAIATGVAATRVRGRVAGWALRLDPRHITLAERLRAGGYATLGVFCCENFWSRTRPTGLEAGFTDLVIERDATKQVQLLGDRLATRGPDAPPLYAWLHFIELHEWAGGDPDMRPEKRRLYDEQLTRIDAAVVALDAALAKLPPERQPIVIITGDHSEALGDHGQPFHSSDLYDSQLQVPLIIAGPGIATGHVNEVVSLLDLAPTILELGGFVAPTHPTFDGRSLLDLLTGARGADVERGRAYAAMIVDRFMRTGRHALVRGRWKLIRTAGGRDELYDLIADPRELGDRATKAPAELARMQRELEAQLERDRASPFGR